MNSDLVLPLARLAQAVDMKVVHWERLREAMALLQHTQVVKVITKAEAKCLPDMEVLLATPAVEEAMKGGGYEGGYGEGMLYGTPVVEKKVRMSVGASIRMVIDLRKQRRAIADALHLSGGMQQTQQFVDYIDLHIERKEMQEEGDPWSGDWEPLSNEDIFEILAESRLMGTDPDIVSPAITRKTITMPLPRRAAGVWQPFEASHKLVENFELSQEEKALINQMNALIAEKAAEAQAQLPPERVQKKGFSAFITDVSDLQRGVMGTASYGSEAEFSTGLYSELEGRMGENYRLSDQQKQMLDESRATAADRLLLVRFMDFTVERGKSYRYRVRLEMRNPNYNVPINQLEQPELGAQQTIVSDWSEQTPPQDIPMDYRYYVAKVEGRTGEAERVTMPVYMEHIEAGMPVMSDVRVDVGMPIGGTEKLDIVDLRDNTLDESDVEFRTRDLLAGASQAAKLSSSDHPDLAAELNRLPRGQKPMPDQVFVIDHEGDLAMRTVGDHSAKLNEDREIMKIIMESYDSWRPQSASESAFPGFDGYEGESGGGAYDLGMSMGNALSGGYGGGAPSGRGSARDRARSRRGSSGSSGRGRRGGYE